MGHYQHARSGPALSLVHAQSKPAVGPMSQWFIFASTESLGGLVPWDLGLAGEHPVPHSHSETDFKNYEAF